MASQTKDEFFEKRKHDGFALTFDDVLLRGARARCAPWEIDLTTRFTRDVPLRMPIASAAMSSVTESKMAIALAKNGGIGSIHRNLPPEEQARVVGKVKHHIHGFIDEPIVAHPYETVAEFLERKEKKGWAYDNFPVVEGTTNKLLGLMTRHNFKRCDDLNERIDAVMTPVSDQFTTREDININDAYARLKAMDKDVLLTVRGVVLIGMWSFADVRRVVKGEKPMHNVDHLERLRVCAAVGVGKEAFLRAELLVAKGVDVLHVDMANAWQDFVFDTAKELKAKYKDGPNIMLGNFAVPEAVHEAIEECNPDGIVVGIGGGSICTTRKVTGTGVPQITAAYECAQAAQSFGIPVCADGGIRHAGDVVMALAVGPESVMVGNLVAGTDETPMERRKLPDGSYEMDYYGMGAERAMNESSGSRQRYLQGQGVLIPEGVEGTVPYKGSVEYTLAVEVGGLRKGLHSNGARTIAELRTNARFNQVTAAGDRESHIHDIHAAVTPPNYRGPE